MAFNRQAGTRQPGGQPAQTGGGGGWLKRGDAGMQQSAQEQEAQAQRDALRAQGLTRVSRYNLRVGEQGDIVILDVSLQQVPFVHEHRMQDPQTQRWNVFETCPKEFDHCPICERDRSRPSQYMMMLSVMDLKGFMTRAGEFVPQSRRLMAVPHALHDTFFNLCNAAMREHGTIRGMHLLMSRETQQEAAIGKPIMMEGGAMYEMMTEEEIVAEFQHPDIFDDQNRLIKAANVDLYAYDYDIIFPKPSGEDLRRRYGGTAPAGSRQMIRDEWQEGGGGHPHVNSGPRTMGAASRTPLPPPPAQTRSAVTPPPPAAAPAQQQAEAPTRMRTRAAPAAAPAADPAPQRVRQRARALDASEAEPIQERPGTPAQPPAPSTAGGGRLRRRAVETTPRVPDDLGDDDPFRS